MFRQLLASYCTSMQHNISEETSFGLVKYNSSKCSRFIHPSIRDYFQPLECDTERDDHWEICQFIFSASLYYMNMCDSRCGGPIISYEAHVVLS